MADWRGLNSWARRGIRLVIVAIFVLIWPAAAWAQGVEYITVFADDFESGQAQNWTAGSPLEGKWAVQEKDGNHYLDLEGRVLLGVVNAVAQRLTSPDYRLKLRVMLQAGQARILFRRQVGPEGKINDWYRLQPSRDELRLAKMHQKVGESTAQTADLSVVPVGFLPGRWYSVSVEVLGNQISISVDGVEKIKYVDTQEPILYGSFELGSQPGGRVLLDDVRVENIRTPQPAAPAQVSGEAVLFSDKFESGSATAWRLMSADGRSGTDLWQVEKEPDGNWVLSGKEHTLGQPVRDSQWSDFTYKARVKLMPGSTQGLHLNYRMDGCLRYFIAFRPWEVSLSKTMPCSTHTNLVSSLGNHKLGQWYTVEIVGKGNHIQVFVDRILRIDYSDKSPFLTGGIGIETLAGSHVHIDDVVVTGPPPQPTPTPTPKPTPRPTPTPGSPAQGVEYITIFADDFESGQAQNWAARGTGTGKWGVQEKAGTHYLYLEDAITIGLTGAGGLGLTWADYILRVRVFLQAGEAQIAFRLQGAPGGQPTDWYLLFLSRYDLRLSKAHAEKGSRPQLALLSSAPAELLPSQWYSVSVEGLGNQISVSVDGVPKIKYADTQQPLLQGGFSLGSALGGRVLLDDVWVGRIRAPQPTPQPPAQPILPTAPLQPEAPAQPTPPPGFPFGLSKSVETLVSVIVVVTGVGTIAGWLISRRATGSKKRHLRGLLDEIDGVYTRFKMNSRRCEAELYRLGDIIVQELKDGRIEEPSYAILENRLDSYMREIRERLIDEKLGGFPGKLRNSLTQMLKEGTISAEEFDSMEKLLMATSELSDEDKAELRDSLARWRTSYTRKDPEDKGKVP